METRHLSALLPLVLPHVPGCPEIVATLNLRLAAIDFCERTRCWRHITTQAIEAGDLAIVVPDYAAIHRIEHAEIGECRLEPIAYTDTMAPRFQEGGQPRYISQTTPQSVMVLPDADGDLTVSLFLKPRNDEDYGRGDGVMANYFDRAPEFVHIQHGEALAAGALSRLMIQAGTEWHNPATATYWMQMFEARANGVQAASVTGQQRAPVRSRTIWF